MKKINHAVICVAGLGSRLGMNLPKALVNILNEKKIIDYQLDLVKDIDNVSIVVGFKSEKIINYVKKNYNRDGIRFVKNEGFSSNSTAFSINLATKDYDEPYVSIDGDLLINKEEFMNFINSFNGKTILGITPSKTEDGVYVSLNDSNEIISFQRSPFTKFEWANIACIAKPVKIDKDYEYVYTQFEDYLPIESFIFNNLYEIDTPNDLKLALSNINKY